MKNLPFFLAILFVLSAFFILFVSLQSANKQQLNPPFSFKRSTFYVEKEILPDHSFYPIFMVYDRFRLELAEGNQQLYLENAYAIRRIYYARRLIEKGEMLLALSTLSKALKYQNQALLSMNQQLCQGEDFYAESKDLAFLLLESSEKNKIAAESLKEQFQPEGQVILGQLLLELDSLSGELREQLLSPEFSQQN